MHEEEIIDRLMRITKDWSKTFQLLDRYPIGPTLHAPVPAEPPKPEEPLAEQKAEIQDIGSVIGKRYKLRAGSLGEQLVEAVEKYPNSTVAQLTALVGRESEEAPTVQQTCKMLIERKIMVRTKNDKGVFMYRLPAIVTAH